MADNALSTKAGEPATAVARERRRNVDRTAATRQQILEATITCLERDGYGAVTNNTVAETAGVSRGAMMHHFPTRQHLLVATVEYAYGKLRVHRLARLAKLEAGLPRYRALIDLAWTTAQMREGRACNEIRMGSRSDPEIRAACTPIMTHVADDYARFVGMQAREAGLTPDDELYGLTATTAMAVRALAVGNYTYPRQHVVESVLNTLKAVREGIIVRQLGPGAALPPEKPAAEKNAAQPQGEIVGHLTLGQSADQ